MLFRARGFRTGSVASIPRVSACLDQAAESLERKSIKRQSLFQLGRTRAIDMIHIDTAGTSVKLLGDGCRIRIDFQDRSAFEVVK